MAISRRSLLTFITKYRCLSVRHGPQTDEAAGSAAADGAKNEVFTLMQQTCPGYIPTLPRLIPTYPSPCRYLPTSCYLFLSKSREVLYYCRAPVYISYLLLKELLSIFCIFAFPSETRITAIARVQSTNSPLHELNCVFDRSRTYATV